MPVKAIIDGLVTLPGLSPILPNQDSTVLDHV